MFVQKWDAPGITAQGVEELTQIQELLRKKYENENFEVELDALPLHQMVWNEMYPAITSRYEDEEGKYGYGYIISSVRSLCRMLTNPTPWIALQKTFKTQLLKTKGNEFLNASESHQYELSAECDEIANSMLEVLIESSFGNEIE
jgi:hypothetical protein